MQKKGDRSGQKDKRITWNLNNIALVLTFLILVLAISSYITDNVNGSWLLYLIGTIVLVFFVIPPINIRNAFKHH